MAERAKKKRVLKSSTVASKKSVKSSDKKPNNLANTKRTKREFNIPLPDNKVGALLNKSIRIIPKYFSEAWQELKLVTWTTRKETLKLSLAVFIFATIFGGLIWIVDFGLDKIFRKVLIG